MSESRKDIVNNNEWSLLDLPNELLNPECEVSILSVLPENDATKAIGKLSQTCKSFHTFFKVELDKRRAKKILGHVLQATNKDKDKVLAEAKIHPELFFVKATMYDDAMDLEGNRRLIKDWSPYQALFGTSDIDMFVSVKNELDIYLNTLKDGHQMADDQMKEKFPDGFDFPESTYDFSILMKTITADQNLRQTGTPSAATITVLNQFRKDFKPGIVSMGHHFNMKDLIKAHNEVDDYHGENKWTHEQYRFYLVNVISFLERLMTRFYLMSACQNMSILLNQVQSFNRSVEISNNISTYNELPTITIIPLDSDPAFRLGEDFYLSCFGIMGTQNQGTWVWWWLAGTIESYTKQTQENFQNLTQPSYKRQRLD